MRKWGRRILFALQFMTRYPIKANFNMTDDDYARIGVGFPIVGLCVGVFAGLCALFASLTVSNYTIALCYVLGSTLITGAFHLDGFCDMMEAIFGSTNREKMLAIMKQSRIGIAGSVAAFMDILIKSVLSYIILENSSFWPAVAYFVGAPIAGRLTLATGSVVSYSARRGGLGKPFIDNSNIFDLIRATIVSIILLSPLYLIVDIMLIIPVLIVPLIQILLGIILSKAISCKLGGITGDTLGFMNEFGELVFLGFAVWLVI